MAVGIIDRLRMKLDLNSLSMKPLIKCTIFFLMGGLAFFSCKKEYSCEGCEEKNKPPSLMQGPTRKSLYQPTVFLWMEILPVIRMGK
jgi:hypothetical protein